MSGENKQSNSLDLSGEAPSPDSGPPSSETPGEVSSPVGEELPPIDPNTMADELSSFCYDGSPIGPNAGSEKEYLAPSGGATSNPGFELTRVFRELVANVFRKHAHGISAVRTLDLPSPLLERLCREVSKYEAGRICDLTLSEIQHQIGETNEQ